MIRECYRSLVSVESPKYVQPCNHFGLVFVHTSPNATLSTKISVKIEIKQFQYFDFRKKNNICALILLMDVDNCRRACYDRRQWQLSKTWNDILSWMKKNMFWTRKLRKRCTFVIYCRGCVWVCRFRWCMSHIVVGLCCLQIIIVSMRI